MAEPSVDKKHHNVDVELNTMQDTPPTPPSPEDLESADSKASRKREREVSIEPATPKADEPTGSSEEQKERRRPATKKNRTILGTTAEEDETPPSSPQKSAVELATSPPHETKVRQISMKVRGLKWDDNATPETSQDTLMASAAPDSPVEVVSKPDADLEAITEIGGIQTDTQPLQQTIDAELDSELKVEALETDKIESDTQNTVSLTRTNTTESDSDDQEKRLKRKLGDRIPSSSTPAPQDSEPSKRARDDAEEDANPREKKRPSPPPEEDKTTDKETTTNKDENNSVPEPVAPQPKISGFAAYASSSSPFASAKGPSVFGIKSTPSPSPSAGTSNGAISSLSSSLANKPSPSPFSLASASKPSSSAFASSAASSSALSTSPKDSTILSGTKRTGFEAFASSSSPFASVARSKSPTGFNRSNASAGLALGRSKSPNRRAQGASSNAFKSYVGSGTQSFASPFQPAKKARQDSSEESDSTTGGVTSGANALNAESGRTSPEGSEEDAEQRPPSSFADKLRAEKNDEETEDNKPVITEQEVQTGEEEDETVFHVRGKLYALSKENAWKERGTGQLKLNVRRADGRGARLLMRKEAVFTLLLNVPLFKGMRCTQAQDPRYLRFSCFENGSITHYNLRLANAKVAGELLDEIKANIPEADDIV